MSLTPYYSDDESGILIYHGDCRAILPQLEQRFGLVLTDPPYGIDCTKVGSGCGGKGEFHRFTTTDSARIEGDGKPDAFWVPQVVELMNENSAIYSFSRWDVDSFWEGAFRGAGLSIKNRIIWEKAHFGSGDLEGAFGFQHETIWRATKGRSLIRCRRTGDVWRDAWTECIRHGKQHPFEKPVDLLKRCIDADSDCGDSILDPFMGSGTTLVAAKQLGRRCVGIELEEKYCEIAVNRLRQKVFQFAEAI